MKHLDGFVYTEYIEYCIALQRIALYRADTDDYTTPYQLEMCRQAAHMKLFEERILPILKPVDSFSETDVFMRTKEIFSNLDKVWKTYGQTDFDLVNDECADFLPYYLQKFIESSECKNFLEGRTAYLRNINF